jgi:uncharacterized protein (TIGR02996 family)
MSRPELLALLQAAKEQPEDDTPRLVLADWLEENGDEEDAARAELIRLQCRLDCLGAEDPERGALGRRVNDLQRHLLTVLRQQIPASVCPNVSFRRGLLGLGWRNVEGFVTRAAKLAGTETWAWVESLQLGGIRGHREQRRTHTPLEALRYLAGVELLATLSELSLSGCLLGNERVGALAASPYLIGLRALDLTGCGLSGSGVAALDAPTFSRLRQLHLAHNPVGLQGVRILAGSVNLRQLAVLRLGGRGCAAGEEVARVLASSRCLTELTHLTLLGSSIRPAGAAALASSATLTNLTTLNLPVNALGDEGCAALATSPHLRLVHLDLSTNQIGPAGVAALASSPALANLATLNLLGNDIGDAGANALAESPYLGRLIRLAVEDILSPTAQDALRRRYGPAVVFDSLIPF